MNESTKQLTRLSQPQPGEQIYDELLETAKRLRIKFRTYGWKQVVAVARCYDPADYEALLIELASKNPQWLS